MILCGCDWAVDQRQSGLTERRAGDWRDARLAVGRVAGLPSAEAFKARRGPPLSDHASSLLILRRAISI